MTDNLYTRCTLNILRSASLTQLKSSYNYLILAIDRLTCLELEIALENYEMKKRLLSQNI